MSRLGLNQWLRLREPLQLGTPLGKARGLSFAAMDFFVADASQDTIYSYVAGPFGRSYNGNTYITYQGAQFDPYCVVYNETTGAISGPYRIGTAGLTADAHGIPSNLIDDTGKMHVFYGCHTGFPMLYAKMTNAQDATAWTAQTNPSTNAAYPTPFQTADLTIWLFFRAGGHLNDWVYMTSTDHGATWSAQNSFLHAGATGTDSFYCHVTQNPANDDFHFTWLWKDELNTLGAPGPESVQRYNIYYAKKSSAGVWTDINGTVVTANVPFTLAYADANLKIYDSVNGASFTASSNFCNVTHCVLNGSGTPHFLFPTGKATSHTYYHATWNGSALVKNAITTTDHIFDDYQMEFVSGTTWKAYVVSNGTSGVLGDYDTNFGDRGGNVEEWTSTNDGVTWAKTDTIQTAESTSSVYNSINLVKNYNANAKLIVPQWGTSLTAWNSKIRLKGAGGYVTVPFETEAKALLNRFASTPSERRQALINTTIRNLKGAGIWSLLDFYYELSAADQQASLLNWVSSTFAPTLTKVGTTTFTADTGWVGDGSTGYLDTGVFPSQLTQYVQNNAHFALWNGTEATNANNDGGAFNGVSDLTLDVRNTGLQMGGRINQIATTISSTTISSAIGLGLIQRTGAAVGNYWHNGVKVGTDFTNASVTPGSTVTITIGRLNGAAQYSTRSLRLASAGKSLTAAQHLAYYQIVAAYKRSVGAF